MASSAAQPTNGFLPKNATVTFGDVTDGLSNTIAVFESGGRPFAYRRGAQVGTNPSTHRVNGGGWCRPASDILFAGSNTTGAKVPGVSFGRTNGYDVGGESYGGSGYPAPYGTEGTSQPYAFHRGGVNVVFGDGSVKFLDEAIHIGVVAALVTRNSAGGEDTNGDGTIDRYKEPILDQNPTSFIGRLFNPFAGDRLSARRHGRRRPLQTNEFRINKDKCRMQFDSDKPRTALSRTRFGRAARRFLWILGSCLAWRFCRR